MNSVLTNLHALGIKLPEAPRPLGSFAPYLIDGEYLYISGQISVDGDGHVIGGKVGQDIDITRATEAAHFCAIGILARAQAALDDLDRVVKLIKLGAFVNAVPHFSNHPKVVNGASDLMVQAFGAKTADHVRFAVGVDSLPENAVVEIEAMFRVRS